MIECAGNFEHQQIKQAFQRQARVMRARARHLNTCSQLSLKHLESFFKLQQRALGSCDCDEVVFCELSKAPHRSARPLHNKMAPTCT